MVKEMLKSSLFLLVLLSDGGGFSSVKLNNILRKSLKKGLTCTVFQPYIRV